ncbi:pyridoxamine 5'-phosphate oxidase family protein [Nocardia thraciensis]
MTGPPVIHSLSIDEALRRLGSVSFGRLVYSRYALLIVRPVDHVLDAGELLVHAAPDALTLSSDPQVVTYQADTLDHRTRAGWFVTVTGLATEITDPDQHALREATLTACSPADRQRERLIVIRPDIITGTDYRRATQPVDNHRRPR